MSAYGPVRVLGASSSAGSPHSAGRCYTVDGSLEPGHTRQRLFAVGAVMRHVLAVRNAERNETAAQQGAPANITTRYLTHQSLSTSTTYRAYMYE